MAAYKKRIKQGGEAPSTPMPASIPVPRTPVAVTGLKRDIDTMMDGKDAADRRTRLTYKQACTSHYSTMPSKLVAAAGLKRDLATMMDGKDAADRRIRHTQPVTPGIWTMPGTPGAAAACTPVGAVECTPGGSRARTADLPAPLTPGMPAPLTPGVAAFTTPAPGTPGLSKLRLSSKTPSAGVDTGTDRNILRCSKGIHLKDPWCGMVFRGDKSCLLYTSPSPRDGLLSRMPSSA